MSFRMTAVVLGLAVFGLAGCETVNDGYYDGPRDYRTYDGPRVYRDAPDYRYSDRRIPPPYYRDGRRDRYDGPSRERFDDGRRYDRDLDDRRDGGRPENRPRQTRDARVEQNRPAPVASAPVNRPPQGYTPPVRDAAPAARPASDYRPGLGSRSGGPDCVRGERQPPTARCE